MLDPELRSKVDSLWDKFWAGGLANPLTAIDQMNYLIFLHRLEGMDDLEARRARARDEEPSSLYAGEADVCRFSYWQNLGAQEMFDHVQGVVFPWMKELAPDNHAFTSFMRDATFLIPRPSLLVEAVNVIADLRIEDRNVDTQGDIYEYMLGRLGMAGQIGQFRTPRHIIRALVGMVDPVVGETVIDPACGTGGFLIAAFQHMVTKGTSSEFLTYDDDGVPHGLVGDSLRRDEWDWLRDGAFVGFDFDPSMVRIAAMNMVLHGIDRPHVAYADSLSKEFDHSPRAHVLLANPPFSGSLDLNDISDRFRVRTGKTELLFLQLFQDLLHPGGRAAVIVPDGVLSNVQAAPKEIRRGLVEDNYLQAVVSFPTGAFRPYTGVKASALVFTRGGRTENVWMYDVTADGYTLDDRRLPDPNNDLPDLLTAWTERREGPRSFSVSAKTITENGYSLLVGAYKPHVQDTMTEMDHLEALREADQTADALSADLRALREWL